MQRFKMMKERKCQLNKIWNGLLKKKEEKYD